MSTARRAAAALATSAVLCVALAPVAAQADPSPTGSGSPHPTSSANASATPKPAGGPAGGVPTGLYGTEDPTHDGVRRQSMAMLGQYAANLRPANSAIDWLKSQQCADGSFPVYRADTSVPCTVDTPRDVNATAMAMQALASIGGQRPPLSAGLAWLRTQQNADGGWGVAPDAPTDAVSTSQVIGAIAMGGWRPSSVRQVFTGRQGYDALTGLSIPCTTPATGGAFASVRPALGKSFVPDARATAAALLGGIGKRLVAAPVQAGPAPTCDPAGEVSPEGSARNGAAFLARTLAPEGGHLTDEAGAADPAGTAEAVVAMCAAGYGDRALGALHWLEKHGGPWAARTGPAGYAELIFAAHTAGVDPSHFGGIDLVRELNATGPAAPTPIPLPVGTDGIAVTPSPTPSNAAVDPSIATPAVDADDSPILSGALWYVAIGVIIAIAVGVIIVNKRSGNSRP